MNDTRGDDGYALLAAVGAMAVFATLAMAVLSQVQSAIVQAGAEIERARADAAADAGTQLAIQHLIGTDRAFRWSLDGRARQLTFAGSRLTIRVVDQRGKIPLPALDDRQVRRMFELLKVPPERIGVVTDSYLDWTDDDEEARPEGAELAFYASRRIHPPNSPPQSIDELALVRGFDASLVRKLRGVATLHFGNGSFEPRHATPLAIAVMTAGGEDSPEAIDRERELAGQTVAIELGTADLAGRTVGIEVEAVTPGGGRSHVHRLVELTGVAGRPYTILESE